MVEKDSKPSILFVVHSLVVGGTENLVFQLAKRLKANYRVGICCLDKKGTIWELAKQEGFELFLIERPPGFNFSTVWKLRAVLRSFSPSIVHAHQYTPLFYSALAKLSSFKTFKLVFTEHGRHFPDLVSAKRRLFNKLIRTLISKTTAVSEFTKRSLVEKDGFREQEIEVIYNGIDSNPQLGFSDIREEFGLQKDEKIIAVVGSLRPVKNPLFALRAFSLIAGDFPDSKLLYLGEGELRSELEELIAEKGLSDQVKLLGNVYPAMPYFGSFNLFVMGSLSEACSLSLLEALQVGVPVLVSNRGGSPELVKDGQFAGVVECDDDIGLAAEMRKVLQDDPEVTERSKLGIEHVRDHFSFDLMSEKYSEVYSNVLDT